MVFNSIDFIVFFPIVVILYYLIPRRFRTVWLLMASYYFYMSWNAAYALLILGSTVVTYACGRLLEKVEKKKAILAGSFVINLGILFVFKYLNFFLANVYRFLGVIHMNQPSWSLKVLLPVGISFYTFQALGYTMDVYRGNIKAEKNFLRYALFVSFFPQLVAGPIERSGNLLSQIEKIRTQKLFEYQRFVSGFSMMVYGMFLKMVLADNLSVIVDMYWDNLQLIGLVEGVFAAIAFSLQIYCDFGAYSLIAIGAARVMGFELMENFNTPYFAVSISDFWRRWHISLSTWFRDYLYIPMGGSRCSKWKKYRNIMVVFLVSGVWHGAGWNYIVWGALHGVYQVIGDILRPVRAWVAEKLNMDTQSESATLGKVIITFALTTFAWIFFRANSLGQAINFLKRMITKPDPWSLFDGSMYNIGIDRYDYHVITMAILILLFVDLWRYFKKEDFGAFLARQTIWFRWIVLIALGTACIVYGKYGIHFDSAQFIYFQF